MTGGASPIPTRGPLMPILAVASLALAGLVWVVPLPFLNVPPSPEPPPPPPSEATDAQPTRPTVPEESWEPLTEVLEGLREKIAQPPTPDQPTIDTTPQMVERQATPPLAWIFRGTIDGPGSRAALITLDDGKSRFVFEGQRLPDSADPSGRPITIKEIGNDYLLLIRADKEERLHLQKTEIANPLEGRLSAAGMGK